MPRRHRPILLFGLHPGRLAADSLTTLALGIVEASGSGRQQSTVFVTSPKFSNNKMIWRQRHDGYGLRCSSRLLSIRNPTETATSREHRSVRLRLPEAAIRTVFRY